MSEIQPVEIVTPVPIPVKVVESVTTHFQDQIADPSKPAKTTFQEDLTFAGQRNINLIWETTQSKIALWVVGASLGANSISVIALIVLNRDITAGQMVGLSFLNFICGIIIGFYFSRTNHAAIGGVGTKPEAVYTGR